MPMIVSASHIHFPNYHHDQARIYCVLIQLKCLVHKEKVMARNKVQHLYCCLKCKFYIVFAIVKENNFGVSYCVIDAVSRSDKLSTRLYNNDRAS